MSICASDSQMCRRLAVISRERVVWVRALEQDMREYRVKRAANTIQPKSYSYATLEKVALRPARFHAATTRHDPRTAPQRSYILPSSPGFLTRAISNVVHGRWLAVASDKAFDTPNIPVNQISWAEAEGKVVLWDLGHGRNAGLGAPVPRLTVPFNGKALLVDLVALPNSTLVFLGYAFGINRMQSDYEMQMLDLSDDTVRLHGGKVQIRARAIVETTFCRNLVALDVLEGAICVHNFFTKTIGFITCNQIRSRHGSVGKSIQLTPTSLLLADPYNFRVYSLPLPPMVPVGIQAAGIILASTSELIPLPADLVPLSVRFLPSPRRAPGDVATLHVFQPGARKHTFLHFGCKPLIFGDAPSTTHTVPEAASLRGGQTYQSAAVARTMDQMLVLTHTPDGLAVVAAPMFDNVNAAKVEDSMEGIELDQASHRPFVTVESGWKVLTGSLVGGDGPRTKRAGVVVDELSARVVLLEARDGRHRVRVIEYV
ncbi:hypothetical protein EXIGLDRAFT_12746 [Exidia glandulosa HHB12029]|uniref:Uncharacterized protein n=1 Tax=Exidia glandulosa HHB12029 TaxID=1314781 RepID=A0A165QT09_EXIGL|nr:hypothetical protein EXIGLDRAFT_12746 [Exidia glandulosa HHB12029]